MVNQTTILIIFKIVVIDDMSFLNIYFYYYVKNHCCFLGWC